MLLAPAALPIAASSIAPTTEFCAAGIAIEVADAGQDERREHVRVGKARLGDQRQPRHPGRLQGESGDHQRALADLVAEGAGDRSDRDERRRPRHQPQAGAERAVAAAPPGAAGRRRRPAPTARRTVRKIAALPAENAARAEELDRQHRLPGAPLPADERGQSRAPATPDAIVSTLAQPDLVAAHQRPHDAQRTDRHEREAAQVEAGVGAVALAHAWSGPAGSRSPRSARSARRSTASRSPARPRRRSAGRWRPPGR